MQITYNGKTYISAPKDKDQTLDAEWGVQLWIASGILKELEEKDEKPVEKPVEEKKEPTNMDIIKEIVEKDFEKACERFSDPFGTSILYQLRSELERRIKPVAEIQNFCENSIRDELIELLDLLNSLSDKQDQSQVKIGSIDHEFTPWQMIEVSQDGEKWEEEEFIGFTVEKKFFCKNKHWRCSFWSCARPIETPSLPDLPNFSTEPPNWLMESDPTLYEQVAILTTFCQAIKARDNK